MVRGKFANNIIAPRRFILSGATAEERWVLLKHLLVAKEKYQNGEGAGATVDDGAAGTLSMLFTFFGSSKLMTVPFRYQTPSPVCHTSSASIFAPLTNLMIT
jgi:hypothetical protein